MNALFYSGSSYNSKKHASSSSPQCLLLPSTRGKPIRHVLRGTDPKILHAKYRCICGNVYYNRASFQIHCRTKNIGKVFRCNLCKKRFDLHGNLKEHVKKVHKTDDSGKKFACLQCSKSFESKQLLVKHQHKACNP